MLLAKNLAKVDKPEVVLPESAHFSFTKIINMLNLKPIYASLDSYFRVNMSEVENLINKNTVAVIWYGGNCRIRRS